MLSFTLDTNCLIAVAVGRPEAASVRALVERHRAGDAVVRLVATTAAENQLDGGTLSNFELFRDRVRSLGLGDLEILKPVAVFDLCYWDWCVLPFDDVTPELLEFHEVLFPAAPFRFDEAVPDALTGAARDAAARKWRNRQLDALVLHTHVQAGADVFVTSDVNFLKVGKAKRLADLGARTLLAPADAAAHRG